MSKTSDIDLAREIASNLAGSLDLLASLHAALATQKNGSEAKSLAATFALLHDHATNLVALLD